MQRGDVQWRNIRGWMQMVLTPYDLLSWNKHDINFNIIDNLTTFDYIDKGPLKMLTLCTLGPLRHVWLFFPSSSCSMLPPSLLGVDCLSRFLSGGPALPHPLPLSWPHFPQVSGNALPFCRAQQYLFLCIRQLPQMKFKYSNWIFFSSQFLKEHYFKRRVRVNGLT
jgi:hypothetical protein